MNFETKYNVNEKMKVTSKDGITKICDINGTPIEHVTRIEIDITSNRLPTAIISVNIVEELDIDIGEVMVKYDIDHMSQGELIKLLKKFDDEIQSLKS